MKKEDSTAHAKKIALSPEDATNSNLDHRFSRRIIWRSLIKVIQGILAS
jgi:hypothetical protein